MQKHIKPSKDNVTEGTKKHNQEITWEMIVSRKNPRERQQYTDIKAR